jgi:hypothetical protein
VIRTSRARSPEVFGRLMDVKRELGLAAPVHRSSRHDPMVYFRL